MKANAFIRAAPSVARSLVLLVAALSSGASAGFAVPPRTQFELESVVRELRGAADIVCHPNALFLNRVRVRTYALLMYSGHRITASQ